MNRTILPATAEITSSGAFLRTENACTLVNPCAEVYTISTPVNFHLTSTTIAIGGRTFNSEVLGNLLQLLLKDHPELLV